MQRVIKDYEEMELKEKRNLFVVYRYWRTNKNSVILHKCATATGTASGLLGIVWGFG